MHTVLRSSWDNPLKRGFECIPLSTSFPPFARLRPCPPPGALFLSYPFLSYPSLPFPSPMILPCQKFDLPLGDLCMASVSSSTHIAIVQVVNRLVNPPSPFSLAHSSWPRLRSCAFRSRTGRCRFHDPVSTLASTKVQFTHANFKLFCCTWVAHFSDGARQDSVAVEHATHNHNLDLDSTELDLI